MAQRNVFRYLRLSSGGLYDTQTQTLISAEAARRVSAREIDNAPSFKKGAFWVLRMGALYAAVILFGLVLGWAAIKMGVANAAPSGLRHQESFSDFRSSSTAESARLRFKAR